MTKPLSNDPNATARDFFEPLDSAKEYAADLAAMEDDVNARPQPTANAGNNKFLCAVKATMNHKIYAKTLQTMRTQGHTAAVAYLQQFFNRPLADTCFKGAL
jgi:hypothetical protein